MRLCVNELEQVGLGLVSKGKKKPIVDMETWLFFLIGDEDCKMFEFSLVVKELMKQEKTLRTNDNEKESGVEQTAMTFLDSHACLISSCKAKRH